MAKLYFLPREMLKEREGLLRVGWRIEALFVGGFLSLLRALPLQRATALSGGLFRCPQV